MVVSQDCNHEGEAGASLFAVMVRLLLCYLQHVGTQHTDNAASFFFCHDKKLGVKSKGPQKREL